MVEIRERVVSEVSGMTEIKNIEHLPPGHARYEGLRLEEAGW
jgi:hypothetical protein